MFSTTKNLIQITVSPDGTHIATEPDLTFHDAQSGATMFQCESSSFPSDPRAAWFLDDETAFVRLRSTSTLSLHNVRTGERGQHSFSSAGFVSGAAISADRSLLAMGTSEPAIHLWDVATGQSRHVVFGLSGRPNQLAFSPDGRTLASSAGGDIRLWNVATGQQLLQNAILRGDAQLLAFSSDGRRLLIAGPVGPHEYFTILSWDVVSLEPRSAEPPAPARSKQRL